MLMSYFDRYVSNYEPYKNGAWCYEDGCIYRGLECLYRATGDDCWLANFHRLIEPQLLSGPKLKDYDPNEYNIDNVRSGCALLYLHELTGEDRYLDYASLLADQLKTHPRTKSGVYWHKLRYPWQIWLDGLYMGAPFQIGYGQRTGDDALVDDALAQIRTALDVTFVAETGLYAHAVDEVRKQPWAHPSTGQTNAHWARALGWLCMALVDVAELVGPERFAPLKTASDRLFDRIVELRRPSGLWLQVIDQPDLTGNYEESSASAMFVYALLKCRDLGIGTKPSGNLLGALVKGAISNVGSRQEMINMVHVAGLGPYEGRYRDGTAAYYVSEPQVSDDAKGVGPLMMAVGTDLSQKQRLKAAAG